MKINIVKTLIALVVSCAFAALCFILAGENGAFAWTSSITAFVSILICLLAAMGFSYEKRNANIKTIAWVFALMLLLVNIMFSIFDFNVLIKIIVIVLLLTIDISVIYSLYTSIQTK